MPKNHFLLLTKFKNTSSAQLWMSDRPGPPAGAHSVCRVWAVSSRELRVLFEVSWPKSLTEALRTNVHKSRKIMMIEIKLLPCKTEHGQFVFCKSTQFHSARVKYALPLFRSTSYTSLIAFFTLHKIATLQFSSSPDSCCLNPSSENDLACFKHIHIYMLVMIYSFKI